MSQNNFKYFIYSITQKKMRNNIEKTATGIEYKAGLLIVGGKPIEFTEMNATGHLQFPDSKVVASGEYDKMNIVREC